MAMTRAQQTAWTMYILRVQALVDGQRRDLERGGPATRVTLESPSENQVSVIEEALKAERFDAKREVVSAALKPLINACDAIDNAHSKSTTVKAIRQDLDAAYQALRTLQESLQAAPATTRDKKIREDPDA